MKYSALLISALAVLAKAVQLTNSDYTITEGVAFTITWSDSQDPVTIELKSGASNDLKDFQTITTSGTGGSFTWTPENIPSGTYAFQITDSSGAVNYSPQFSYQGTGTVSSTTSTASSTASTTGSSSTSSETKSTTSSARLTSTTMTPLTNSTTMSTSTHASTSRGSSTATTTSSSSTSTATEVPNTNNGQRVASSLVLVLGAVAAFIAFN